MKPQVLIDLEEYERLKKVCQKAQNILEDNVSFQLSLRDLYGENIPGNYIWCSNKEILDEDLKMQISILTIANQQLREELKSKLKSEINKIWNHKKWWQI